MIDPEVERIAEVITQELWRQSVTGAPDAPTVWDSPDVKFLNIDGAVNILAIAEAVVRS
jgi:hypothetical protein